MTTWDDIAEYMRRIDEALLRMIRAHKSMVKTYAELIEYCKRWQE